MTHIWNENGDLTGTSWMGRFSATAQKTFAAGRQCVYPGCATILSVYNAGECCYAHGHAEPLMPTPYSAPVPATSVQEHVVNLIMAGWTGREIAQAAHVANSTVSRIMRGRVATVEETTERALLALEPKHEEVTP